MQKKHWHWYWHGHEHGQSRKKQQISYFYLVLDWERQEQINLISLFGISKSKARIILDDLEGISQRNVVLNSKGHFRIHLIKVGEILITWNFNFAKLCVFYATGISSDFGKF
jgi:hypothetical protein